MADLEQHGSAMLCSRISRNRAANSTWFLCHRTLNMSSVFQCYGITSDSPVVLYWCETWSLILREEHRRRVFENRVLRRKFGRERKEVTRRWRKLRIDELRDLYSSPSTIRMIKSRKMRWMENVARMGEKRNTYRLLVGKSEGDI
jgi:hypothetical protein